MGISYVNKYQNEGGPGLKECFALLKKTQRPAVDYSELMKRVIFNYLIGNNDAHGKNFSLLYSTERGRLSPLYDVLCTTVYEGLTTKMAMKIGTGKNYDAEKIFPRHWEQLCDEIEFSYPVLKKQLQEMCARLESATDFQMQALSKLKLEMSIIKKIALQLQQRIKQVNSRR